MTDANSQASRTIRIGAGAGYAGDRIEPAVELARDGQLDYLVFECLAERTIALAQLEKLGDPGKGYDPLLQARMSAVLPYLRDPHGKGRFRIISNMGAANPIAAAQRVAAIASELGLAGLKVAAVTGDDVLASLKGRDDLTLDIGCSPAELGDRLVSANAYMGAQGVRAALEQGADVVITGRVADPSLFLAAQMHAFGWADDDWLRLGRGTLVGHLLECAGQVTGGYFADPGYKDVEDLARLGFPIAVVDADGGATITKVAGSGGQVTPATCAEQLMYEVHDPARYLTPDVTANFSNVAFEQTQVDQVRVAGATGAARPETLKVSVGYLDGYIGEGQISYGGPGALARAELAREVVLRRLQLIGVVADDLRADLLGINSLHGDVLSRRAPACEPWEVRLRVAARCPSQADAVRVANEVEALYTNGPSGGGGASKVVRQVVAVASLLWPREQAKAQVHMEVAV